MRLGPDLIGPSFFQPLTLAKPVPKPVLKNQTKTGSTQRKKKLAISKGRV